MKNHILLITLGAILLLFASCAPVYLPSSINAPMLTNRGEVQVNLSAGTGLYPQVAYAITNHVGIMGNISLYKSGSDTSQSTQGTLTLGLGYFGRWGKHGRYEIYFGTEGGSMSNSYSDFKYKDWFVQPTIGYTSDILDLGLSSSFVMVTFNDVKGVYLDPTKYSTVYWQPALTAKIGYKRVRFLGQLSLAVDLNQDPKILVFPFTMSLGVNINLGQSRYVKHSDPRYH